MTWELSADHFESVHGQEIKRYRNLLETSIDEMLGERRFFPNQTHGRVKPALAARTRRAGAGGGFSSSSSTRRESRSDSFSCSASQISALACGSTLRRM